MDSTVPIADPITCRAMRRLLDAIDRATAAAREVEAARAALDRAAHRQLRLAPAQSEEARHAE